MLLANSKGRGFLLRPSLPTAAFTDPGLHYMQVNYFDVVLLPSCVCENDL